ncbi:MAG: methyltransferase domain-containing protein, partial [Chitinophagaceae bacterium]
RKYYLHIYATVLDCAKAKSNKPINELALLDFGSGNGLLGLFARYCGFGEVMLCDINRNFVHASSLVAKLLEIQVDSFVNGDLTEVKKALHAEVVDVVVGTDVIEHIYNLDNFFKDLVTINPRMVTVFTTASNPENLVKVKQLKRLQVKDELVGGDPEDFALAGEEKHPSYLEMRRRIIEINFPALEKDEVFHHAAASRGLMKEDIIKFVAGEPIQTDLPFCSAADSNTCHPETGSWSERILSLQDYRDIYSRYNFNLAVENGFYNSFEDGVSGKTKYFMNLLIKILGKKTAPFITLIGFPKA